MTQRKSSAAEKRPSSPPSAERFVRPDATTAAQGGPTHEHKQGEEPEAPEAAEENDRAHGYTQDSGYQASGGYAAEAKGTSETVVQPSPRSGNGHAHSDSEIGADVQRRLLAEATPRAARLMVRVGDGIVTLSGEVDDENERERLLGLVRGVASVREVRDQLIVHAGRPS